MAKIVTFTIPPKPAPAPVKLTPSSGGVSTNIQEAMSAKQAKFFGKGRKGKKPKGSKKGGPVGFPTGSGASAPT